MWMNLGDSVAGKQIVGIPWRVAFALQADGWYLRSDIIWAKSNPMPESVTDRPTRSHEYIFLLSKSRRYYYDRQSIRERLADSSIARINQPTFDQQTGGDKDYGSRSNRSIRKALVNLRDKQRGHSRRHAGFSDRWDGMTKEEQGANGRNKRDVWTVATHPFPGSHFATFPPALIEPCILAGAPDGGIVLDPFCGSGTTGMVALRHNRKFIGIELNPEYRQMSIERIQGDAPLFNTIDYAGNGDTP
jgi:DNA modification methylase